MGNWFFSNGKKSLSCLESFKNIMLVKEFCTFEMFQTENSYSLKLAKLSSRPKWNISSAVKELGLIFNMKKRATIW